MPRYASRYHRRYHRRSRTLSKVNIASNKSARAQSKQIAALSRKLNIVARNSRPETHIIWRNWTPTFTNSSLATNFAIFTLSPYSATYSGDDNLYSSTEPLGNFNRCKGISVKLVSQYTDNWRDTIADESHDQNCGYRIVVFQEKRTSPISESNIHIPAVNDIFNVSSSTSSDDTNLTAPLTQGISSVYKILYAKTFLLSRYVSTKQHNIYIPGSKCLNFMKEVNTGGSSGQAKGRVYVAILSGGLHWDTSYAARLNMGLTIKIAYTDN